MNNTIIGLDLAKRVFHFVHIDRMTGKIIAKKKLSRGQVSGAMAQQAPSVIAMEACASSHYWARVFQEWGHEVRLYAPQHVKGYVRGQKNDYNDALAIAEAALHGRLKAVPVKTEAQQEAQAFHRIRRQLIKERVSLSNQLRGLLGECGIVIPQGPAAIRRVLPELLEAGTSGLRAGLRELLSRQYRRFQLLEEEIAWYDAQLKQQTRESDVCRRLIDLPAFGTVVSSAFSGWIGDGRQFSRGRDASAALGLVPRQHSTGGKEQLSGITKRGDSYVRCLVIHGARAVVSRAKGKSDPLSQWINRLVTTRGFNKAVVALANKLVRIAWVIVARGETYQPREA